MSSDTFFLTHEARVERARCVRIAEKWMSPAFVQTHFGSIGEFEAKAIHKIAVAIKKDILDGEEPKDG